MRSPGATGIREWLAAQGGPTDLVARAPATFDQRIDEDWRHGATTKLTRPIPSVAVAPVRKAITAADVLAIRARLALDGGTINTNRELVTEGVKGIERIASSAVH